MIFNRLFMLSFFPGHQGYYWLGLHHGMFHMTCDVKVAAGDGIEDRHAAGVAHRVAVGRELGAFHQNGPDLAVQRVDP